MLPSLQAYDAAASTLKEAGNKISETVTGAQHSAGETAQQVRMRGHLISLSPFVVAARWGTLMLLVASLPDCITCMRLVHMRWFMLYVLNT
jgi:hypothetical protein